MAGVPVLGKTQLRAILGIFNKYYKSEGSFSHDSEVKLSGRFPFISYIRLDRCNPT